MAQGLTYTDAVKLLGGAGPFGKAADDLVGAALLLGTAGGSEAAISLFDAKGEAFRLGHRVAGKITDLVRGQGRYHRGERLHAAHAVLAVSSFFGALGDCLESTGLRSPDFTREDQLLLVATARTAGSWQSRLLDAAIPAPSPEWPFDRLLDELTAWYAERAAILARHLPGLAVWDAADDRARRAAGTVLAEVLPGLAREHYEQVTRRLAAEIPEFAIWMTRTEARATSRGLERLETLLLTATSHAAPLRHRAGLAAVYRADLDEPILGGDAGELIMPSLGLAYLDPWFRVRPGGPGTRPADEDWWAGAEARTDFDGFLAVYLTTPQAATVPLLLLGQPGGGKSSLTRILAARLPAADFLVVRVALREIRAESEVQDQIEQTLRGTLGETVAWADLAGSADGAMPVILLDGLDELLQATGVHQSDYLERVAAFQRREARLGRPVAVIVTSRVAVADRARLPAGGLAVRLEPFAESQVDRWLEIWNTANAGYWTRAGRKPLTHDVIVRFPELAGQPLLLLMLALYDAGANALQDTADFDTGQLYERLLHDFAGREVRRVHGEHLPESDRAALVDEELLRLSVVAFAMFHRLRLWATADELDADLRGLGLPPSGTARHGGFERPFTAGEEMVGRFFFIQRTQAFQDDQTRRTYEFLHATFGEYLVARLVVQAVREATALSRARSLRVGRTGDDDLLRSLLGYTPLCARGTVMPFVTSLLARSDPAELREWLVGRLRAAVTRPSWAPLRYQPVDKRVDHWMATYSFNLLLIVLACGGPVRASELFLRARDPAGWLRDSVLQWRGSIPGGMFLDALKPVQVTRMWADDERRDMALEVVTDPAFERVDPLWSHRSGPGRAFPGTGPADDLSDNFPVVPVLTSMALSGAFSDDVLRHAADPVLEHFGWPAMTTFIDHGPDGVESVANSLLRVLLARNGDPAAAYERAARALGRWHDKAGSSPDFVRCHAVFQRSLAGDAGRLAERDVARWAGLIAAE
ncbi:NACHT domain-containing protein [Actinoplanes sp. G11-F43]|uniref:NACHT domain-containing protein n=1 Tax=Actinoplanes sp. G11-F43 TaxID=3424130 RepID=UPI003D3534DB